MPRVDCRFFVFKDGGDEFFAGESFCPLAQAIEKPALVNYNKKTSIPAKKVRKRRLHSEQVEFQSIEQQIAVFGVHDGNVRILENALSVSIQSRDTYVEVSGEAPAFGRAGRHSVAFPAVRI